MRIVRVCCNNTGPVMRRRQDLWEQEGLLVHPTLRHRVWEHSPIPAFSDLSLQKSVGRDHHPPARAAALLSCSSQTALPGSRPGASKLNILWELNARKRRKGPYFLLPPVHSGPLPECRFHASSPYLRTASACPPFWWAVPDTAYHVPPAVF